MKNMNSHCYRALGKKSSKRGQALLEYVLMLGLVSVLTSLISKFFLVEVWNKALGPGSSSLYQEMVNLMKMGP